ncbi:ABC transporter [Subtercola boreus]|uniref:ABC transporter n=1 Tax=Subtercola boreus TaxID=120213 RepID=A0A3E0VGQ5_9MICO|nr:ABC transporter ATP-binding protein [Subtercola boreus]RFA09124.1 ABC transporter [Subtercola boreus]TQL53866.1 putative ABC transport system ATP-binding protein/lipoprotein-releasing system ATP-binding protein [Subtercola boreus]
MPPRLEARDLRFGFRPGELLFDGWNTAIAAGELVALTGPSGRGKSTLLHLLGLMVRPAGGAVLVDGQPTGSASDAERARLRADLLGFVFQDALLDPGRTVLDNVLETALYRSEPRRASIGRARELLARFGVERRADARPGQLSGGQAQRIALCRALMNRPGILLADEPTGNLDAASAAVVLDAFREVTEAGAAVLVATHDPWLVAHCDRVVEL